jgi:RNA-directed DNA polymerase
LNSRDDKSQPIFHLESHAECGEAGSESASVEVVKLSSVWDEKRALTQKVMEHVCAPSNLNQAFKRVKSNKGAAGIDGMTVETLHSWILTNKESLVSSLLEGSYRPSPVRRVEIPKPSGGSRMLGIPTVVDRFVQQALLQVLQPIFEPNFSDASFGFRPGKSAHDALLKASHYVAEGRRFVVDVDLEKFFDRVNHDILMSRVARYVGDKRLLSIVRRFLSAGHLENGVVVRGEEGTPQGGPLSPLLSNIMLDDLDKELERRGHKFCRYADDCNIYVASEASAERVLASVTNWLETKLKLKVNRSKSAAASVDERKFLGYRLLTDGRLTVAPESLLRFRQKICKLTKRRKPGGIESVSKSLTPFLHGWWNYFRLSQSRRLLQDLDGWIRRRLRAMKLKQLKRWKGLVSFLVKQGVTAKNACKFASSGKGKWRLSSVPQAQQAMNNKWFESIGFFSMERYFLSFKPGGTA